MKKVFLVILAAAVLVFSQDAALISNKHMIGVDISTLTGSGIVYRFIDGDWGFKGSAYGFSSSKANTNGYSIGLGLQRSLMIRPLTRLYCLAGTSFRQYNYNEDTDYSKNYFNIGVGFGVEARALQAVRNEDIVFFFEVGEKYFSAKKISDSSYGTKFLDSGLNPFFTMGCGVEF